ARVGSYRQADHQAAEGLAPLPAPAQFPIAAFRHRPVRLPVDPHGRLSAPAQGFALRAPATRSPRKVRETDPAETVRAFPPAPRLSGCRARSAGQIID